MAAFLIGFFTILLLLVCVFLTLVVLMQKPSSQGTLGGGLGGGVAEQAFGGETTNVLTKTTIYGIVVLFVVSFDLYLGHQARAGAQAQETTQDAETLRNLGTGAEGEEEAPAGPRPIDEEGGAMPIPEDRLFRTGEGGELPPGIVDPQQRGEAAETTQGAEETENEPEPATP